MQHFKIQGASPVAMIEFKMWRGHCGATDKVWGKHNCLSHINQLFMKRQNELSCFPKVHLLILQELWYFINIPENRCSNVTQA